MRLTVILVCLLGFVAHAPAQAITSIQAGNEPSHNWTRVVYENDLFHHTDRYYTQGINVEVASTGLSKLRSNRLLLLPRKGIRTYGLALEHDVYTPTSITSDTILKGDRPFAATLAAHSFGISYDTVHHRTFTTALSLGIIGPAAGGREMQTFIHEHTGNSIPRGWQYQLSNDVMLNYYIAVEQRLLALRRFLYLSAKGIVNIGTLNIGAGLNATAMAGLLPDRKPFALYVTCTPTIYAVGYNATLQGGVLNHKSPYTIAADNINRLIFQNKFSLTAQVKHLRLSYTTSYITTEFKTGTNHVWGGIEAVWLW